MTLAELLVYMVLLMIVMALATGLYLNVITTQSAVSTMAQENNEGQLLFDDLERDARNALWADVRWNGNLLVMGSRTASAGVPDAEICSAYFYDTERNTLYSTRSSSAVHTLAVLNASDEGAARMVARGWPMFRDDVERLATPAMQPVFAPDGEIAAPSSVSFEVVANASGDRKRVVFSKSVALRPQGNMTSVCR